MGLTRVCKKADAGTTVGNTNGKSSSGEPASEPLDCVVRLVTPERIVIEHPLAGPSRRFMAYLVDQVLLVVLVLVASPYLLFSIDGLASGDWSDPGDLFYALTWGYGHFCEGVFNGQTVGKRTMGIRVVSERGVPISGAQAVLAQFGGGRRWPVSVLLSAGPGEHGTVDEVSAAG